MNMKRNIVLPVILAALLSATVMGCGKKQQLFIYNWTYYTPQSVIEKFEKEYKVTVLYDEFASNEDMYAKIKAGGSGYDIVFPSGDYVSIMINQNMLEKIDKSQIPNIVNIDPAVLKKSSFDPNMDYSVPYYYGAAGVMILGTVALCVTLRKFLKYIAAK